MGFSVASCDHGGRMMGRTMLDKSGTYSKLSAKSRVEFTAEHGIAATCSVASWKFAIFVLPMHEIFELTESDQAVSV